MAAKSRKEQLAEMLEAEPRDVFIRYALAMEYVSEGNDAEAARRLAELTTDTPDYPPAYLQQGQALIRLGRDREAREVLQRGVAAAQRAGDHHAAGEMQGLLDGLG